VDPRTTIGNIKDILSGILGGKVEDLKMKIVLFFRNADTKAET